MNDDQVQPEQPAARRRLGPMTALAAGSLAGLVLGFGGIASAQTEAPAPAPSTSVAPEAEAEDDAAQDELCDKEEAAAQEEAADSAA